MYLTSVKEKCACCGGEEDVKRIIAGSGDLILCLSCRNNLRHLIKRDMLKIRM